MNSKTTLKSITPDVYDIAVSVYKDIFPNSTLSILGSRVIKSYFSWFTENDWPCDLLYSGSTAVGFHASYLNRKDSAIVYSTSSLTNHLKKSLLQSLLSKPWLFLHPRLWKLVARKLQSRTGKGQQQNVSDINELSIHSFGIVKPYRRKSFGKVLISNLEDFCKSNMLERLKVSVQKSNQEAIRFYQSLSFETAITKESELILIKYL